jgi:hypothetical protein
VKKVEMNNIECLCIPRVQSKITENQIKNIFNQVNIGIIDHIDIITKKDEKYKRVFIHMKKWFATENAKIAQERLQNNQDIKIIYEEPWFWKISVYKKKKK